MSMHYAMSDLTENVEVSFLRVKMLPEPQNIPLTAHNW